MATDQRKMKEGYLYFRTGLNTERGRHNASNGICWQLKGSLFFVFNFYSNVKCSL